MTKKEKRMAVAPLGNIDAPECWLRDYSVALVRTPQHMNQLIAEARQKLLVRDPANFLMCLAVQGTADELKDITQARQAVEDVILLLRLFKPGNVYCNFILSDPNGWFDKPTEARRSDLGMTAIFPFKGWDHPGLEPLYRLSDEEAREVLAFADRFRHSDLLSKRAFQTFFRGYHEPYPEDRFLRNAIGLENVFINDTEEQSNVRYKFVDRGCFMLQLADSNPEGANAYARPLRRIYDERCKLVHSNDEQPDWRGARCKELIRNSDKFLRASLKLILETPKLAEKGEIDRLKREAYGVKQSGPTENRIR